MASMREHLRQVHEAESAHHEAMAKSHEQLAECFGKLWKANGGDDEKMYQAISAEHDTMAKAHQNASEYNGQCADDCMKAHEDYLGKTLVPDRVSSVAAMDTPFGIKAIPRAGAPMIDAAVDKASVPVAFRHLIADPEEL
jgi:hypothetical protein